MDSQLDRRAFVKSLVAGSALILLGTEAARGQPAAPPPEAGRALTPDEKRRLKEELQRELERKVYAVDEALFRAVNRAREPGKYRGHETSHVPKIAAPRQVRRLEPFAVKVIVGVEELHEMQVFHYVDWIALRLGGVQLASAVLTPLFCQAMITFDLVLEQSATLIAQEHCNLHGTWESEPWQVEVV
jgi:desulfoferrodoxin (superoxide reductase-like protein)